MTDTLPEFAIHPVPVTDQHHAPVPTSRSLLITLATNLTSEVSNFTQPNAHEIILIKYLTIAHLKKYTSNEFHMTTFAILMGPNSVRLATKEIKGNKIGVIIISGTMFLSPAHITSIANLGAKPTVIT